MPVVASSLACHDCFFFISDTATTEIYTPSLDDALPISATGAADRGRLLHGDGEADEGDGAARRGRGAGGRQAQGADRLVAEDRKSTPLNFSHANISYARFCFPTNRGHHGRGQTRRTAYV